MVHNVLDEPQIIDRFQWAEFKPQLALVEEDGGDGFEGRNRIRTEEFDERKSEGWKESLTVLAVALFEYLAPVGETGADLFEVTQSGGVAQRKHFV